MNIAIYGGSFNPPHLGHREAVITALEELKPDRLLIMPDHQPPHKEMEEGSPTPEQRLELCRLTFGDLEGVEVSSLELDRRGKSYTYDTVCDLERAWPDARLTLIIGTDMLLCFEEWYHFEYLLEHCRIAALARDYEDDGKLYRKENAYVFDFAPERTLTIFDDFANNLNARTANGGGTKSEHEEHIKRLLNFFPVIAEDDDGKMVELDAAKVLTIPKTIKAKEVIRRGFMSNFLFQNIGNIFSVPECI